MVSASIWAALGLAYSNVRLSRGMAGQAVACQAGNTLFWLGSLTSLVSCSILWQMMCKTLGMHWAI